MDECHGTRGGQAANSQSPTKNLAIAITGFSLAKPESALGRESLT